MSAPTGCGISAPAWRRTRPCLPCGRRWRRWRGPCAVDAHASTQAHLVGAVDALLHHRRRRLRHFRDHLRTATASSGSWSAGTTRDTSRPASPRRRPERGRSGTSPSPWTCRPAGSEAPRAAHAGDGAEPDPGLAEPGIVAGQNDVAHHRQPTVAAERQPPAPPRSLACAGPLAHPIRRTSRRAPRRQGADRSSLLDVGADRERPVRAGKR